MSPISLKKMTTAKIALGSAINVMILPLISPACKTLCHKAHISVLSEDHCTLVPNETFELLNLIRLQ
ncbi:hypothetical protein SULPSESMR1_00738 [Pseudosulfitobacter pseudonitzschiae]|uniref:Uncharacterized protein n=1 Tax=Pseudosulfitobacter pseudonitzschiae TaxID=1402135 RepID=A0A221JXV2_9RHOB|nr:hypothetical protein SULPSESMR1_00738 [Pseudosulfitobacter pseudonitzschiae]